VLSAPSVAGFDQRNVLLAVVAPVVRPSRVVLDRPLAAGAVILPAMAFIVLVVLPRSPLLNESRTDLRAATPDPVLAVAASRQGHLATSGDLSLVQLRTRRPVLIDGLTLDSLPYAIESGPTVGGILETAWQNPE
jgi:hypothetical protein